MQGLAHIACSPKSITLHECTHTTWQGCPDVGGITVRSVARMTSTPLSAHYGPGAGTGPQTLLRVRRRPGRGQESGGSHVGPFRQLPTSFVSHRPRLRKLFLLVTAKGRPRSLEKLFPCNPGGRQAREGRGGGGSAEGPVFAFISSNRRFYLWKRTDAGD